MPQEGVNRLLRSCPLHTCAPALLISLLLASTPDLAAINVQGTLIFDDTKTISLNVRRLTVFGTGVVHAGSCDCPFTSKVTSRSFELPVALTLSNCS
jgi:hypothetical protein